jgi:mannitol/fructose-specific phosphotransferase system IIA component (Ntr-type)
MSLIDLIQTAACNLQLQSRDKDDCLKELADLIAKHLTDISPERVYRALLEREALGSTGFENGIAIPHAKIEGLNKFYLAFARAQRGIKFESHDGKKSTLFFVIIGPAEASSQHLQILAQISRVTRQEGARSALMNAHTPVEFKETFVQYAEPGFKTQPKDAKDYKLLAVVLTEPKFFDDVIQLYIEHGIKGATILDSSGIRQQLMNIPLFSSFLDFLGEHSDTSKTILSLIHSDDIPPLVNGIEELTGNLNNHTGAMVMAIDLFYWKGSMAI